LVGYQFLLKIFWGREVGKKNETCVVVVQHK
jgi:hypothetical protein